METLQCAWLNNLDEREEKGAEIPLLPDFLPSFNVRKFWRGKVVVYNLKFYFFSFVFS